MKRAGIVACLCAALGACRSAGAPVVAAPAGSVAVFERHKGLDGAWSGTATRGDASFPVETRWRTTGAGSAVEEVLFFGTQHEMITMYHLDGARLMLTHYCAARNQPRMTASAATFAAGGSFEAAFAILHCTNLASPQAMHMHDAQLSLNAEGVLRSRWTAWSAGKPDHDAVFELRRR